MGKYLSAEEVLATFDQKVKDMVGKLAQLNEAVDALGDIFTAGIQYTDKKTGAILKSEKNSSLSTNEREKQYRNLYGEGEKTLGEICRPGSAKQFMTWYCLSKGITHDQILSLVTRPDAPETKALREKLDGMKNDYRDLVTSNDPERISGFYMDFFQKYHEYAPKTLQIDGLDALQNNLTQLLIWSGVTGTIQQSFEDSHFHSTEKQTALMNVLNKKIKEKYGENSSLRDVLGTLQAAHQMHLWLNTAETELDTDNGREPNLSGARNHVLLGLRTFLILNDCSERFKREGKPFTTYSSEMCKASVINMFDYNGFDDEDTYEDIVTENSTPYLSEVRAILGDKSGFTLYDRTHLTDYAHEADASPVTAAPTGKAQLDFFNIEEFSKEYRRLSKGRVNEIVAGKMETGEPLSQIELIAYTGDDNPEFGREEREIFSTVMDAVDHVSHGDTLPIPFPATMDPMLAHALDSAVQLKYNVSIYDLNRDREMTVEGYRMARENRDYFQARADAIAEDDSVLPDLDLHRKNLNELKTAYNKAKVTLFSSGEFKALNHAMNQLGEPDPKKAGEYCQKLENLLKAAEDYITAKNLDGKTERETERGRDRIDFARRARAFAFSSLEGIRAVQNAANERAQEGISGIAANEIAIAGIIRKRIDDMLSPEAKGSPEIVAAGVYHPENFPQAKIAKPDNCPFSDHELAMFAFTRLTDGSLYRGTIANNRFMDDTQFGTSLRVHTIRDIFVIPRFNADHLVEQFGTARDQAMQKVREYMAGNPKPLAQDIGNNIRTSLSNFMQMDALTSVPPGEYYCLSEPMKLLRTYPDLMKNCGLSLREVTLARYIERVAELAERKEEALNVLNNKDASIDELKQAVCDISTYAIINNSFKADKSQYDATPEAASLQIKLVDSITHMTDLENEQRQYESTSGATEKRKAELREKLKIAQENRDYVQFKMETMSAERPLNQMVRFLGGKGSLESKQGEIFKAIQKTDAFQKIVPGMNVDLKEIATEAAKEALQNAKREWEAKNNAKNAEKKMEPPMRNLGANQIRAI